MTIELAITDETPQDQQGPAPLSEEDILDCFLGAPLEGSYRKYLVAAGRAIAAKAALGAPYGRSSDDATPRFKWCCENGCGPCEVKRTEFEFERIEDVGGRLLKSSTIPRLVSACCGADLTLWDNERDERIDIATEPMRIGAAA